jgi:N6-adenosine-specific RNA methylase IME4
MPDDSIVKVGEIVVPRKRMRTANHIEELAESIRKNGLLHPITLRRDGEQLILVAGKRRLEAIKILREGEIRAKILDVDKVQALLIEIDENLQRAELTELQRAQHISERKKVWESLYPQTKHGGTQAGRNPTTGKIKGKRQPVGSPKVAESATFGAPSKSAPSSPEASDMEELSTNESSRNPPAAQPPEPTRPVPSFVQATAEATQTAPRTVRVSSQIGSDICRQAQFLLEGTPLENRKTDLLKIARLCHEDQIRVAQLIHDDKAKTYQRAWKILESARIASEPQPLPGGPFRVIVADPPWHYDKRDDDASKRENTGYATMSLDSIKDLEVESISTSDAVLWLWTTNAHMPEAFSVARAWGFTYKTMLTWDKIRIGMGDWLRGQTEHCLMCVRGRPTVNLTNQTTLMRETSTGHSKKPEAFYSLVESLCPGSKVELFSRYPRQGWIAWGSESLSKAETKS